MKLHLALSLWLAHSVAFGQPKFEVASIKPAPYFTPADLAAGQARLGIKIRPGRAEFGFMTLEALIAAAYQVERYQVSGASSITSQPFDIVTKLPEGASKDQVPAMLQALLAERFKLQVHHQLKDVPAYALIAAKNGPQVQDAASSENDQVRIVRVRGSLRLQASSMTMTSLAKALSPLFDRPVVNGTGMKGSYRFALFIPDSGHADSDAFLREIGMKLEARKAPIDHIVVDRCEKRPTFN